MAGTDLAIQVHPYRERAWYAARTSTSTKHQTLNAITTEPEQSNQMQGHIVIQSVRMKWYYTSISNISLLILFYTLYSLHSLSLCLFHTYYYRVYTFISPSFILWFCVPSFKSQCIRVDGWRLCPFYTLKRTAPINSQPATNPHQCHCAM